METGVSIEVIAPVQAPKTHEVEKSSLDALLVFGQGPVLEGETRMHAASAKAAHGSEDVNLWSHTLAQAASELYHRGQTREIIVMGGKTGGDAYGSEAELISSELQKLGVPVSAIKLEKGSTNTLTNIVNMLNEQSQITQEGFDLGILGSNQHLGRLRVLMDLFCIPYRHAFSAEEVVRFAARDKEEWDDQTLLEIEQRLDVNAAARRPLSKRDQELGPGYYGRKQGEEQKNVYRRRQEEQVWQEALFKIPEYWIGYLGQLNDASRIITILDKWDKRFPELKFLDDIRNRFGIALSDDEETLRKKLAGVERKAPSGGSWIGYLEGQIKEEWGEQEKPAHQPVALASRETPANVETERPTTNLWFLRHAPTSWNKEKRVQGNADTHVMPEALAGYLDRFDFARVSPDVVIVSALSRSEETARALQQRMGWEGLQIVVEPLLNERKWGIFEGKTHPEVRELLLSDHDLLNQYPYLEADLQNPSDAWRIWTDGDFKAPGGESLRDVYERVIKGLAHIHEQYVGKRIVSVVHAGVLQSLGLDTKAVSAIKVQKDSDGNLTVQK